MTGRLTCELLSSSSLVWCWHSAYCFPPVAKTPSLWVTQTCLAPGGHWIEGIKTAYWGWTLTEVGRYGFNCNLQAKCAKAAGLGPSGSNKFSGLGNRCPNLPFPWLWCVCVCKCVCEWVLMFFVHVGVCVCVNWSKNHQVIFGVRPTWKQCPGSSPDVHTHTHTHIVSIFLCGTCFSSDAGWFGYFLISSH